MKKLYVLLLMIITSCFTQDTTVIDTPPIAPTEAVVIIAPTEEATEPTVPIEVAPTEAVEEQTDPTEPADPAQYVYKAPTEQTSPTETLEILPGTYIDDSDEWTPPML